MPGSPYGLGAVTPIEEEARDGGVTGGLDLACRKCVSGEREYGNYANKRTLRLEDSQAFTRVTCTAYAGEIAKLSDQCGRREVCLRN